MKSLLHTNGFKYIIICFINKRYQIFHLWSASGDYCVLKGRSACPRYFDTVNITQQEPDSKFHNCFF